MAVKTKSKFLYWHVCPNPWSMHINHSCHVMKPPPLISGGEGSGFHLLSQVLLPFVLQATAGVISLAFKGPSHAWCLLASFPLPRCPTKVWTSMQETSRGLRGLFLTALFSCPVSGTTGQKIFTIVGW